jgi:hypothetical protein
MSSKCFENPSVHPQEALYLQFYGISFTHPYKQLGIWYYVLPEDEHSEARNMSKIL